MAAKESSGFNAGDAECGTHQAGRVTEKPGRHSLFSFGSFRTSSTISTGTGATTVAGAGPIRVTDIDGNEVSLRTLKKEDIVVLEGLGNYCDDWSHIAVENSDTFDMRCIRRCSFYTLQSKKKITILSQNTSAGPFGLVNSNFHEECFVSRNCVVNGCNLISNVFIDEGSVVQGCDRITANVASSLSKGKAYPSSVDVSLGAESYGRHLRVYTTDTFVDICNKFLKTIPTPSTQLESPRPPVPTHLTYIGKHCSILSCPVIENCYFGCGSTIESSTVRHSFVDSLETNPARITDGAVVFSSLIHQNCKIERGAIAESVVLCESSAIGEKARVHHSVIGPDSSVAGGECHFSVLGPFVGFHHESLLIASFWPDGRGNIAYSARVGANHTGRVNDQECWVGEGCFFGMGCTLKFPVNLVDAPYSMVAPGTVLSPQIIQFPFSLISPFYSCEIDAAVHVDGCFIKPGWVLTSNPYMLERYARLRDVKSFRSLWRCCYQSCQQIFKPSKV
jgi:carbonic anhydrase/acetyltransferase-like protein (isoleucine patch superfamily)